MQIYPPGTRIGQYEIASRPMMGGMGVVYLALDHGNDERPVALKTFRPELLPDRAARDRFLREGTAWVELGNHPHIVRCYKVEYIDPTAFLVLELIAKEQNMPDASLRSWLIPGRPLPLEQALLFAVQIARGMQYATEKIPSFVHRDLKPENILVGADKLPRTNFNCLRVTDFGLVKSIAGGDISVTAGNVEELKLNQVQFTRGAGTPLYMAPEQWRGEPVGAYTDLYAFGCILYEMLTGNFAFVGRTIPELQEAHCSGRFQALPANLNQHLTELVTKCFTSNLSDRYQSWNEISEILDGEYRLYYGDSLPKFVAFTRESRNELIHSGLSYISIGYAYRDMGQTRRSINYFEKALKIGETERLKELIAIALNHLGQTYKDLGDAQQAISYYEQALSICSELSDQDGQAAVLNNLGLAYEILGDSQQAIKYCERAIEIYQEMDNQHGVASVLGNLGMSYLNLGDGQRAIEYHEQALSIDRKLADRRAEAVDMNNLGDNYRLLGDYKLAIKYYEQSLLIQQEIGDRTGEGTTLSNLGTAYRGLEDLEHASVYLEKALSIAHEVGNRRQEGICFSMLGLLFQARDDMTRAIENYQQAMLILSEVGDQYWEAVNFGNLGIVYSILDNTEEALRYYEKSLQFFRRSGNLNYEALTSFNMAMLYYQSGDSSKALPLAEKATQIWSQMGNTNSKQAQEFLDKLRGINKSKIES